MVLPTHLPIRLPKAARLELAEDLNVPADVTPPEDGLENDRTAAAGWETKVAMETTKTSEKCYPLVI